MIEACRAATPEDVVVLVEFAALGRDELHNERDGDTWRQLDARRDPLGTRIAAQVADPDAVVVVATLDAIAVGYGVATTTVRDDGRPHGTVTDLFVLQDAREIGLGTLLLDALTQWCSGRGCIGIDALALPGARLTKNFFETSGFVARAITVHRRLDVKPHAADTST